MINVVMAAANVAAFAAYMASGNPLFGLAMLGLNTLLSFLKGWHLTASIGMPRLLVAADP
jgi:hypothetical protein